MKQSSESEKFKIIGIILGIFTLYGYLASQFFFDNKSLSIIVALTPVIVGVLFAKVLSKLGLKNRALIVTTILILFSISLIIIKRSLPAEYRISESKLSGAWRLSRVNDMMGVEQGYSEGEMIDSIRFFNDSVFVRLPFDVKARTYLYVLDDNYVDIIVKNDSVFSFKVYKIYDKKMISYLNGRELIFMR